MLILKLIILVNLCQNSIQNEQISYTDLSSNKNVYNLTNNDFDLHTKFANNTQDHDNWLVMFYAPWCPHCHRLMPTFGQLADQHEGQIKFGVVDCDNNSELKYRFDISGYPSLVFFSQGRYYTFDGNRTQETITQFLQGEYIKSEQQGTIQMEYSFLRSIFKMLQLNLISTIFLAFFVILVIIIIMLECFLDNDSIVQNAKQKKLFQQKMQQKLKQN